MDFKILLILLTIGSLNEGMVIYTPEKNMSEVAIALSQIINGLQPRQLAILSNTEDQYDCDEEGNKFDDGNSMSTHVDDFMYQLHKLYFKSVIFYNVELFFHYIESNLQGSIESVNLIFCQPYNLSKIIQERKLAHRLSLFIFYWDALYPPKPNTVYFEEPIRAVVITRPRKKAFRIYYNQAVPHGYSNLKLVNWYDGDNLGLQRVPLLPQAKSVYSNFKGRMFRVPVFHSPPWFWVDYVNDTDGNMTSIDINLDSESSEVSFNEFNEVNVTGGRDHRLLCLLAKQMNFQFIYLEAPGRTQGSLRSDSESNESFTGGIGLLQNGVADFFLGDVGLSWERRRVIEFSFFTLADSGAFVTHAPRRLNEAFAIIRPFKTDVWPYLIVTIVLSVPIFYFIILLPLKWQTSKRSNKVAICKYRHQRFYMAYIHEITMKNRSSMDRRQLNNLNMEKKAKKGIQVPEDLLSQCIWFTVKIFLKQSCKELSTEYRLKFLMIVYWIAATYVLADVYSAQLTSQFARPAHEAPINTLQRLQKAMIEDNYKLFVEKESSSLEMLENGTEVFRHLFALMKKQGLDDESYLIDSVESGIKLIADGLENKAVLGGRETLYFNIQQYGSKTFQLSQKLYTRYSAVAVQIGCSFLDSLNDVLIHLFEGGIMEKMTIAEYEAQSRMLSAEINKIRKSLHGSRDSSLKEKNIKRQGNGKSSESTKIDKYKDFYAIRPLNMRMLQGAFIALSVGYGSAGFVFGIELLWFYSHLRCLLTFRKKFKKLYRKILNFCWEYISLAIIWVLHFKH